MNFGQPNPQLAVIDYRSLARDYDANCSRIASIRNETIALLELRCGDRVLDVASGTGLSFPNLRAAVGNDGYVTGIELSPVMCELARQRIQRAGWQNVSVAEGSALSAEIATASTAKFDAVLFHYTHDVSGHRIKDSESAAADVVIRPDMKTAGQLGLEDRDWIVRRGEVAGNDAASPLRALLSPSALQQPRVR